MSVADLDQLEARHTSERAEAPDLQDAPRPMAQKRGATPPLASAALHKRAHRCGVTPALPWAPDPIRCAGPWWVSIDAPASSVFNATGRWGAFARSALERAWIEGAFTPNALTSHVGHDQPLWSDLDALIKPSHDLAEWDLTFTPTGADAVHRAAHLLTAQHDGATLITLPQLPLHKGRAPETTTSPGFLEALQTGVLPEPTHDDPTLANDLDLLKYVHARLTTNAVCQVTLPAFGRPTARLLRALRRLTQAHDARLLLDATQTSLPAAAWARGVLTHEDAPDAVTLYIPSGVGICATHIHDPEPMEVEGASLLYTLHALARPAIHPTLLQSMDDRLTLLTDRFPNLRRTSRRDHNALLFDLPNRSERDALHDRLLTEGVLAAQPGDHTLAVHIPAICHDGHLDTVFKALTAALAETPTSEKVRPARRAAKLRVRVAEAEEADTMVPKIRDLEARIFEPARRDSVETLRAGFIEEGGSALVAEAQDADGSWTLVGYAVGAPLEWEGAQRLDGCKQDIMTGRRNTLYSIAISVDPAFQGYGLGRRLKQNQLRHLRTFQNADGSPRYRYVTGRNRVGLTPAMTRINRALGGHTVKIYTHQYGEPDGQALYYRIPVWGIAGEPTLAEPLVETRDLSSGLSAPLAQPPKSVIEAERRGDLAAALIQGFEPGVEPSPAAIQAMEWLRALVPALPGLTLSHSRDGALEEMVGLLRRHRPDATVLMGVEGGYVGHNSPAALRLSDPAVHRLPPGTPPWRLLPHPSQVSREALEAMFTGMVAAAGGADRVVGIFAEVVQERTGRCLSEVQGAALMALGEAAGIPVVLVETATAHYRSGLGPFASAGWARQPDAMLWWGGGRVAAVHTAAHLGHDEPRYDVLERPSWGGELALLRVYHQLRAIRGMDLSEALAAMDAAMDVAQRRGVSSQGLGLYRVLDAPVGMEELHVRLNDRGVRARRLPQGGLVVAPGLDVAVEVAEQLVAALGGAPAF